MTSTSQYVGVLMSWIEDKQALFQWAGPGFRYPYDLASFSEDLQLDKMESYGLVDGEKLLAFGQWYSRWQCRHLSRLIVAPDYRGKRINQQKVSHHLINGLIEQAGRSDPQLVKQPSSLFVLADNGPAVRAYQQLGFRACSPLEPIPIENCLYMRRAA
ncbi:GNAT family N-acetyltransferase [Shewanella waksmanii]|uniref:GNAT family N-acetyltransferase n=1 Tax=Shewanella waksmanii TaxID=213783 RepID=UPI003734DCA9